MPENDIKELIDRIEKLKSLKEDEKIVEDSKFVDPRITSRSTQEIQKTPKEARHERRYLLARQGQPVDETGIDDKEKDEASDEIAKKYVQDFIDRIFA